MRRKHEKVEQLNELRDSEKQKNKRISIIINQRLQTAKQTCIRICWDVVVGNAAFE